jgi:DNA repair ATPase RecN
LRSCTQELIEQKVEDKSNIEDVLDHLQNYWESLTQKIELMNAKLKTLPETREKFDKNLHNINTWLNDIDQNKRQLNNNDLTVSEYKRLIEKLKVSIAVKLCTLTSVN